ncbi:MAG TPA: tetratricopeptide repeat protein [Vicinamibacteria bacterium]|nr:tetratricopeptide repeat protein [Vicinamibacteria bacterium]
MRLALLILFLAAGAIYTGASWHSYREDVNARTEGAAPPLERFRHPEAHLRILRAAIAESDYTDQLLPHLEGALDEAPSFYQPPLLMAAFYANRLERPERIRQSFEAAIARFPSNGRLHLTYAEWLLTPRTTAPYRAFRAEAGSESRTLALDRIATATSLEPDLARPALELMLRFQVPVEEWSERLPRSETTQSFMLDTVDRTRGDRGTRAQLLSDFLETASTVELLKRVVYYAEKWQEPEIALRGAMKWREVSTAAGEGGEIARSTVTVARHLLRSGDSEGAYRLLRETLKTLEERSLSESALELLCLVGDEYARRRQHAMAQGLYSEAVAMSRYHAPAYIGLARNYRALGDLESARRELEELLQFDPSNEHAVRELEELRKLAMGRR